MSIAVSVQQYLFREHVPFNVIVHAPTWDSAHSAESAHISGHRLAKSVVLEDEDGYVMAVIPASHKLDLQAVREELHRTLNLSNEHTIAKLFKDCEPGAVPPLPGVYGIDSVVDQILTDVPEIYLEGGDHRSLIRLSGEEFRKVIAGSPQRHISHPL
jgi:Ala-tRNA(Pro) deacylase